MKKLLSIVTSLALVFTLAWCGKTLDETVKKEATVLKGAVATDGSISMSKLISILGESFTNANLVVDFNYNPID